MYFHYLDIWRARLRIVIREVFLDKLEQIARVLSVSSNAISPPTK